jgi:hypothetical protein
MQFSETTTIWSPNYNRCGTRLASQFIQPTPKPIVLRFKLKYPLNSSKINSSRSHVCYLFEFCDISK